MKKLSMVFILLASLLLASPAFAYPIKHGYTTSYSSKENNLTPQELAAVHQSVSDTKPITPSESKKENFIKISLTEDEIDLLARLVRAEAQTEPYEGKIAVACVVLNRVESKKFPDTIKEVIYAPRQFQPVQNGEINKPADEESIKAVKAALSEQRQLAPGALFFYNPAIATSRWLDTRTTTKIIGQHVFKK
ncbi:cell wall hydrolase [Bacillaceae bacterium C204]|uniref:cell wall hydrolase n=1 Tax=Neobacillus sp. 204 TaxID=3383351 RepID=UPI00397D92C5